MSLGISAAAWTAVGAIGSVAVGAYGASQAGDAAEQAGQQQADSAQAGIAEQRRQFDQIRTLLNPYVNAGTGALTGQQNLLGLSGANSQASAIDQIQNSPAFKSMLQRGENSILQNASATGGLRGGNVQNALAQFSPQLLAQQIQQHFANLGGITSLGQNAAVGVGNAGMSTGQGISSLLQQQGAAQSGATLGGAAAQLQGLNSVTSGLGTLAGYGGFGRTQTGIAATAPTFGAGAGTAASSFGQLGGFGATPASSGGILGYPATFGSSSSSLGFGSGLVY